MKKAMIILSLLLLAAVFTCPGQAMAETSDVTGEWVCVAVDLGDGVKSTQFQGAPVSDLMKLKLGEDGTLVLTSQGGEISGSWSQSEGGISLNIEGQTVVFSLNDGQLVNTDNGVTMYLEKAAAPVSTGGLFSLIKGSKYTGKWAASAVDEGDGILKEQIDGVSVASRMSFQINRDGTLVMTSMGFDMNGVWQEISGGIVVTIEGEPVEMLLEDGQLVGKDNGTVIYFKRADAAIGAEPSQAPPAVSGFAGVWEAIRYEVMGGSFDIKMVFPDGCSLTLREDGTGEAFITKDYTEQITWSESGGSLSLSGSYVFSSPAYDAAKGELSLFYGSSAMAVIFQKTGSEGTSSIIEPTAEPSPVPTTVPTPVPSEEPAPTQAAGSAAECVTNLFTALFAGGEWTENTGWRSDREDYSAVRYELKEASGTVAATIALTASSEGVRSYRDKIKQLEEYAGKAGKDALDETVIGGIRFFNVEYENWGWKYIEYAARVPDSRVTLTITVEQPEVIGSRLQAVLDSISFKLPVLNPPNIDPPMPEDGTPYQPVPGAASVGDKQISVKWLKPDQSIFLDSIFDNHISINGGRLYVLAGKTLYAYTIKDDTLVPDASFSGGRMVLDDEFDYLSAGQDGILYLSQGFFNILSVKDGTVIEDNDISGNLVMHPGGEWGLTFWANADPMLVRASGGALASEPWVLSGLSDAANRKGRFSSISCIAISDTQIYVAGTDATKGDAQRVAVLDLQGNELLSFGAEDWMADDAFGSVTGILETPNSILVQDGNYRVFKLFSRQGEFVGAAECDPLLGTDYPWLSSMIPYEGGALVAASQSREDESADELLIFVLSGF